MNRESLEIQIVHSPCWYHILGKAEMFSCKIDNVDPTVIIKAMSLANSDLAPALPRGYFEFPRLLANKITYKECHLTDMMLQNIEWSLEIVGSGSGFEGSSKPLPLMCSTWRLPSDQRIDAEVRYHSDSWVWRDERLEKARLFHRHIAELNFPPMKEMLFRSSLRTMEKGYFPYSVIDHVYQAIRSQNVPH